MALPSFPLQTVSNFERYLVCFSVGLLSKSFLNIGTKLKVENLKTLIDAIENNRPVITFSNHDSTIDDPLLFGALPWRYLWSPGQLRWSIGAQEIVFKGPLSNRFFSAGRVIPVVRGNGIFQKGMDFAIERLNSGDHIHIFCEGRCNLNPVNLLPFRWGIARLIMECKEAPLILPFYHSGMAEIIPVKRWRSGLNFGKSLTISFGDLIDGEQFRSGGKCQILSEVERRIAITSFLQSKLQALKEATELSKDKTLN